MNLILASASPRRQSLLKLLGLPFTVRTVSVDERMDPDRGAAAEVQRVCRKKAEAAKGQDDELIIAADTIVCVDDAILGKPASPEEAVKMLRFLSGRTHQVRTGVTVCCGGILHTEVETTDVRFRPLSDREIAAYAATGEPMDKAGAYGIQGSASVFVEGICGDYFNVMGLPLCRLTRMLREFGIPILGDAVTR